MNKEFMELFDSVEDVIGNLIKKIRLEHKPAILFGAGYCISMILDLCITSKIDVHAIVDNDTKKCGKIFRGIAIISIDEMMREHTDYPILISTSHYKEIIEQLKDIQYSGTVYHLPTAAYYKNTVYSLEYVYENKTRFENAYNILEDECSKKVFVGMIKHNISLDEKYLLEIRKYEINGYFGTELYVNSKEDVIVDAGAFNGDTIDEFLSIQNNQFKRIYAFEPDIINYNILKRKVYNNQKIVAVCAGLGKESKQLRFITGGSVSSRIDEEGNDVINIDTIDHFFSRDIPTFIKMDIEGAEKDALLGGKKIIAQYHPTLAVSVYHKKEDMYDLIETIQRIGEEKYKFYIRHTFFYQKVKIQPDVILYAVSER